MTVALLLGIDGASRDMRLFSISRSPLKTAFALSSVTIVAPFMSRVSFILVESRTVAQSSLMTLARTPLTDCTVAGLRLEEEPWSHRPLGIEEFQAKAIGAILAHKEVAYLGKAFETLVPVCDSDQLELVGR